MILLAMVIVFFASVNMLAQPGFRLPCFVLFAIKGCSQKMVIRPWFQHSTAIIFGLLQCLCMQQVYIMLHISFAFCKV